MLDVVVTYLIVPLLGLYAYMAFMLWLAIAMGWEIRLDEGRQACHPGAPRHPRGDRAPDHPRGVTDAPRQASSNVPCSRGWMRMRPGSDLPCPRSGGADVAHDRRGRRRIRWRDDGFTA